MSRRLVLAAGFGACAFPLLLEFDKLSRWAQYQLLRARVRKPLKQVPLMEGFYREQPGDRIHYVPNRGITKSLRRVSPTNLQPLAEADLAEDQYARVHSRALLPWIRSVVKEQSKRGEFQTAANLIERAIHDDQRKNNGRHMPNIQLYDLMAGLAVRSQQPEHAQRAVQLIKLTTSPTGIKKAHNDRSSEITELIHKYESIITHANNRHDVREERGDRNVRGAVRRLEQYGPSLDRLRTLQGIFQRPDAGTDISRDARFHDRISKRADKWTAPTWLENKHRHFIRS